MLRDKEAARLLNSLVGESRTLFGSSDSLAFIDFLRDYFCVDDPSNQTPGKLRRLMFLPLTSCALTIDFYVTVPLSQMD